jgi:hypothetical protein
MLLACALSIVPAAQAPGPAEVWERFPAFLWREPEVQGDREVTAALLSDLGATQVMRAEDAAWLDALGVPWYVFNAAGRDILHLERGDEAWARRWRRWDEQRDDALLVRVPCLTDPATRARLHAELARTLERRGGHAGLGLSLGDEVSLTAGSGPEDVCLSPTCRAAWTAFLDEQEDLTEQDRAHLADPARWSTDRTRLALAEGHTEALHGWLLRRRFHQEVVLARLDELAVHARCAAPGVAVALLGLADQSAFGGVSTARVLPWLDIAEAYREVCARELLFTLRAPRQRVLLTVFVDPAWPAGAAWQVWEHWMRGGDGVVVWSEAPLARDPRLAQRLGRALADVRRAQGALPARRPRPSGVAVVESSDAIAAGWLRDALLDGPTWPRRLQGFQRRHGTREPALAAWLRLLEDCGAQPGAVLLERVGAQTAARFPLLVLEHLLVLGPDDEARLAAHLAAGGHLLVRGELGWVDRRGRRPQRPPLERLRALAPGRVHSADGDIAGYAAARDPRASAGWRARARGWLERAGVATAPLSVAGGAANVPWLRTWWRDDSGLLWCALLPAEPTEDEVLLELDLSVDARVRWLHPSGASGPSALLPPGDAAVLALPGR